MTDIDDVAKVVASAPVKFVVNVGLTELARIKEIITLLEIPDDAITYGHARGIAFEWCAA